ncbi:Asp/Glu/hydantoin racemase [Erwinia toletana]|uniref:Asp/Glu/hydantoin racemase n=1 Tax=Winslowiella toletana TaxID=92490 RepID=A0ABS4P3N3_9GAMM|nr:aspartate/glutamate racemase family protein [Winslowiella toletana]MBP2167269.1 Asp/Glu/hydantoin racemase [Winslowiella toletana]
MSAKVAVIRVVTSSDQHFLDMHQTLIATVCPTAQFTTRCLPDQPDGIHNQATLALAEPKLLALGQQFQQQQYDALVVSCAADPAVAGLRAQLTIPVIGAGEACCRQALTHSNKVGAIGIEAEAPAIFHQVLGAKLLAYHQPDGVNCTHDIHTDAGKAAIIAAVLACEADGAEVIALACTGMATTDVAALVAPHTRLPVINPVIAAGQALAALQMQPA